MVKGYVLQVGECKLNKGMIFVAPFCRILKAPTTRITSSPSETEDQRKERDMPSGKLLQMIEVHVTTRQSKANCILKKEWKFQLELFKMSKTLTKTF